MNPDFPYQRGMDDFRKGRPCPPQPADDVFEQVPIPDAALRWMGWRVALGADFIERCAVAQRLNCPRPEL